MNANLVTIHIGDYRSLLHACDFLHDARCDLSTVQMDETRGVWKARFEREFFEDPSLMTHAPKLLIFTKTTFPLAASELILEGVKQYRIEDHAGINVFTFNQCQIVDCVATLFFCESMKMMLEFHAMPCGSLVDHALLAKTGSMVTLRKRSFAPHGRGCQARPV